jgi:pyruvate kinase
VISKKEMIKKKTKIVATMGPACATKEVLKEMIAQGVDVCRVNFSHGSHEDALKIINLIKELRDQSTKSVAILADLQGPKMRIGAMENDFAIIEDGAEITITTVPGSGTKERISINYDLFPKDVKAGERILLDDGKLALEVIATDQDKEVKCKVIQGGVLSSKKGVNLPNTKISMPSLTKKDLADLEFALDQDVDWIGLSFVRSARDIIELKQIIKQKNKHTKVVAKIEKPEAIREIDDILKETDAIMVARGDLGVEIPMQNVPLIQKMLVKKALKNSKPVIIATQMMESMIDNITPTRAEVNDVANAVLDGADAVMLSGETSVGKHPIKVIEAMSKIVREVENSESIYHHEQAPVASKQDRFITDSVCYNACRLAHRVGASAIATLTFSGYTAFKISSQRPKARITVFTGNKSILNQLSLVWGVETYFYNKMESTDATIKDLKDILKNAAELKEGELIVNTASMPIAEKGMTNMLKLSTI